MKFLPKHFAENGKEKLYLNDPSFCKCQNEYYPYNPNLIKFLQTYIFLLTTHLFVIFVSEGIFFQKYIDMELNIFHNI